MDPEFVTLQDVIEIHKDQIVRYGGSPGIRDIGLLESAVAMPQAGMRGRYFHADPFEMAAAYLYHLVKNHPFVDGNKRVGLATALVFLELNGEFPEATNEALVDISLAVAEGKAAKSALAEFFRKHCGK